MFKRVLVFVLGVLALLFSVPLNGAQASVISASSVGSSASVKGYVPIPDWSLTPAATSQATTLTASWACHGHADPPHTLTINGSPGIGYDAYQDCTGAYDTQRVCVQLWSLDYYGTASAISTVQCGAWTVSPHAYFGRVLGCSNIGRGHVRYFTKSTTYADPPGGVVSASGQSNTAYLC